MNALIDTSFLLATVAPRDANHALARATLAGIKSGLMIAAPVLTELFYMVMSRVSYDAALQTQKRLTTAAIPILTLTQADYTRMDEIMRTYRTAAFDFADAAQMALAERHNIQQIYTFDHRDFLLFRARHVPVLDVLP